MVRVPLHYPSLWFPAVSDPPFNLVTILTLLTPSPSRILVPNANFGFNISPSSLVRFLQSVFLGSRLAKRGGLDKFATDGKLPS